MNLNPGPTRDTARIAKQFMDRRKRKIRIGIVGCGAIGSRIAKSVAAELKSTCELTAVQDIDLAKAVALAKACRQPKCVAKTLPELLKKCDLVVEAVNAPSTREIIQKSLRAGKDIMAMSVGKLLEAEELFRLARRNRCHILIPSGAVAGLDAIKAASLAGIDKVVLTSRKPVTGFSQSTFVKNLGLDLTRVTGETLLFEGDVRSAVRHFPQNINVAATIALAGDCADKLIIRILTSPTYKLNSHEIEVTGAFGRLTSKTENVVCPDNPKTSYLAVLSGIQTLKDFCQGTRVGT